MNVAIRLAEEDPSFLDDRMSRWVDGVLGYDYHRYRSGQAWSPAINLYEDDAGFHLVADLAGIDPEVIDLRVNKNRLILRGVRPSPRPLEDQCAAALHLHHMEIEYGPFTRTVNLPEAIDVKKIEACYRNGFLWVKMPLKR
ncbi:MAG: Hsp20/alpha crystallin family protein [Planctomycetota bacterium]|nr:Hsp20/alpha crystallin family protein [Planctomycetota bacterium]